MTSLSVTFAAILWYIVFTTTITAFTVGTATSRRSCITTYLFDGNYPATFSEPRLSQNPDHHLSREQQIWGPPSPIHNLKVGEHVTFYDNVFNVTKVCHDPPIFVLRGFLTERERESLIESQVTKLTTAKTSAGVIEHRTRSSVAWVAENENSVAEFMTQLTARIFCPRDMFQSGRVQAERLQVVQYQTNGKFDLHHDGYNRTVTVLTYLNGIAGTWFPYVGAPVEDIPTIKLEGNSDKLLRHKQPGRHGIVFVGEEAPDLPESQHVVRIRPGDAVAFYNYQYHDEEHGPFMAWRSLHCGLPAKSSKWIATNWFTIVDR